MGKRSVAKILILQRVWAYSRKRANGFEPSTFSLEGCEQSSQVSHSQDVTSDGANERTNVRTNSPESVHSDDAEPTETAPVGEHFAEAIAMLTRLPLSDAERAEAVRRLLAGGDNDGAHVSGNT